MFVTIFPREDYFLAGTNWYSQWSIAHICQERIWTNLQDSCLTALSAAIASWKISAVRDTAQFLKQIFLNKTIYKSKNNENLR